jgi:hypothetical protein
MITQLVSLPKAEGKKKILTLGLSFQCWSTVVLEVHGIADHITGYYSYSSASRAYVCAFQSIPTRRTKSAWTAINSSTHVEIWQKSVNFHHVFSNQAGFKFIRQGKVSTKYGKKGGKIFSKYQTKQ